MKNSYPLLQLCLVSALLAAIVLSFAGCGGDDGTTPDPDGATMAVTGTFAQPAGKAGTEMTTIMPADVTTVYSIRDDGQVKSASVNDQSFSLELEMDQAYCLVFTDATEMQFGYLSLGNGVDCLPLTNIDEEVGVIDFQNLVPNGEVYEPTENPLGGLIALSPLEQTLLGRQDDFFTAVLHNPDVDGDGRYDFLDHDYFGLFFTGWVMLGSFDAGLTAAPRPNPLADGYGFALGLNVRDDDPPASPVFVLPDGTQYSTDYRREYSPTDVTFGSAQIEDRLPTAGTYLVQCGAERTLTFPDMDPSCDFIPFAVVPTVSLNNDGTLHEVSWAFFDSQGQQLAAVPSGLIQSISVQIMLSAGGGYNEYGIPLSQTRHVLTDQNMAWSEVERVDMALRDVLGNDLLQIWFRTSIW